jgi:PilZ domain
MSFEKRKTPRRSIRHRALIVGSDKSVLSECAVSDVSATGARLRLSAADDLPDEFYLILSKGANVQRRCAVKWRSNNNIGVQFVSPVEAIKTVRNTPSA